MPNRYEPMTLQNLCKDKGVCCQDVEDILELYGSDAPEEEILDRISRYPENARSLAASIILPPVDTRRE